MDTFTFGRIEGFPSRFSPRHWPVTIDVTETIFVLIFVILAVSCLLIAPGYSKKRSIYVAVKTTLSLLIGCFIVVGNFGQEWEIGVVNATTPYRAGVGHEINASISLKIGLRSMNVTLRADPPKNTPLEKEVINYNERFRWTWDQGRFGFGPNAGLLQRSFREAQRRGVPLPILWVAEYFVIDGEGIRFGRFYRTAGWYSHILLWTAFACWILANIFLQTVGRYAAYLLSTVGGLQILTCIVWIVLHNPTPLVIPFDDRSIRLHLGLHFWMTLSCGIVCVILAIAMIFADLRYPNSLSAFLGIDPLDQYDECVMRFSELESILRKKPNAHSAMEMNVHDGSSSSTQGMVVLKRRSTIKNAQKSLFRPSIPMNIDDRGSEAIYENQSVLGLPSVKVQRRSEQKHYKPPVPKKVKGVRVVL